MGITWYFFNHTLREFISPFDGHAKAWEILANHPSMNELLAYSILELGTWSNCRIEAVGDPEDFTDYEDVTVSLIIGYNLEFLEWPRWGPESFRDSIIVPSHYLIKDNAKVMIAIERDLSQFIESEISKGLVGQWHGWEWSKRPSQNRQKDEP